MLSDPVAAHADAMQAKAFCEDFARERSELSVRLAKLVKRLTEDMNSETSAHSRIRREIRRVETEMRQIDRLVYNLERRFTDAGLSPQA